MGNVEFILLAVDKLTRIEPHESLRAGKVLP